MVTGYLKKIFNNSIELEPWSAQKIRTGLLFLALLILISRLFNFNEAFERDLMYYMATADGLLHGRPLYAELFAFRPPAVFWTYALFAKVFGVNPLAIFMMGLTCAWLTLWGCYIAGRHIAGPWGGLLAAATWAVMSGDLLLQANQPNTEVFINASLVGAFALLMGATPNQKQIGRFIAIGLLYCLASLFKQISLVVTATMLIAYVLIAPWISEAAEGKSQKSSWEPHLNALKQGIWVVLIVVSGWALVIGYFQWQGHLAAFKEALVDYGRGYAGDLWANIWGFLFNPLIYMLNGNSTFYAPLVWLLTVLTAGYFWRDRDWRLGLCLAYFGGCLIAIALPGRFFPHYFQLWLPPLAIAAGSLLRRSWLMKRKLAVGLLLIAFLPLAGVRLYQHTIPVEQAPFYKYGLGHGPEAVESKRIGLWIAQHIDPKVIVYQWGEEPGVYFWARRSIPVGIGIPGLFMGNPPASLVKRDTDLLLKRLKEIRPGLIIANKRMLFKEHPIVQWMSENYVTLSPNPEQVENFLFLVPNDERPLIQ